MTDEINYTELAELVFKAQRFPAHLVVTTGVRDYQTGHYVSTVDKYGTTACIELAMRLGAEKGVKPLGAVFTSSPDDFKHVYKQEQFITLEQGVEIERLIEEVKIEPDDFKKYMKVDSIGQIKAGDYKKALNAIDAIKKAQK